jgi:peptidoglycan/LPS O-acetylase OafA/YrhL
MSKSHFKHQPQLDGLRTFCIIFTIFNHIPGTPTWINGGVGVDVFFALSGFLITTLLVREKTEGIGISVRAFYIRRAFRIIPLYVVAFGATALGAWILSLGGDSKKMTELSHAWPWVLTFNRELCPVTQCGPTLFGHGWTIGIEEKFYIAFPLFFMVFKSSRALAMSLIILALAASAFLESNILRGYVGIIFGCLSALWFEIKERAVAGTKLWLTLMIFGYGLATIGSYDLGYLLISFGASWLILAMVDNPAGRLSNILKAHPFAWLGKLTYGVYLFHVLVINVVSIAVSKVMIPDNIAWAFTAAVAYVLTVALAHQLHIWIEQPLISHGKKLAERAKWSTANQNTPTSRS